MSYESYGGPANAEGNRPEQHPERADEAVGDLREHEREELEQALTRLESLSDAIRKYLAGGKGINKRVKEHVRQTGQMAAERGTSLEEIQTRLERRTHDESFRQAERLFAAGYRVHRFEGHNVEWPEGSGNYGINDGVQHFALLDKDGRARLAEWEGNASDEAHAAGEVLAGVPEQNAADKDNPYSVLMFLLELSEEK